MKISKSEDSDSESFNQFLTFIMAGEEYAIDILCVQEIRGWEPVTPLPNASPHLKGVINLRGNVVPIIDLRLCFGLEEVEYGTTTVIVVVKIIKDGGNRTMGLVVDGVSDVYSLAANEIQPAPDVGHSANTDYITGLASVNSTLIILIDVKKLFEVSDMSRLSELSSAPVSNTENGN